MVIVYVYSVILFYYLRIYNIYVHVYVIFSHIKMIQGENNYKIFMSLVVFVSSNAPSFFWFHFTENAYHLHLGLFHIKSPFVEEPLQVVCDVAFYVDQR